MRSPSALAVNYLLSLDDQLTPALAKSEKGYVRFTKSIEKLNARAEKSVSKTFNKMAAVVGKFADITDKATGGRGRASSNTSLANAVANGVAKALKNMKLRLHAALPSKKSGRFNTSANLSKMYKGMAQPPDLYGAFEAAGVKKYAKGGLVTGTAGKDKVPALLTAGEWVLTKDQVKDITKAAGALRAAKGGGFVSGNGLTKAVTEMKVLTAQADKLKVAAEEGLDPMAAKDYARVVQRLAIAEKKLTRETMLLSRENRIKLAPSLGQVRREAAEIAKNMPKAQTAVSKFLKSIASSTAFLAIHTAIKTVQEDFLELKAAGEQAVGEFGVDTAADGLVTNFNQMNRVLGLSRDELYKLRADFVEVSKVLPLSIRDVGMMSEAMQDLIEKGAGPELAKNLTPAVHAFARATGVASESTTELAYRMAGQLKMGAKGTGDMLAYIAKVGATAQVSVAGVTDALAEAYTENEAFFKSMDPKAAAKAMQTLTQVAAAGESITVGLGKELATKMAQAASGNEEAFNALAGLGLGSMENIRAMLQSGDMTKAFNALQGMDPAAMRAFATAMGISNDAVANLTVNMDDFRKKLAATKAVAIGTGDGLQYMAERAQANQSTFEALRSSVGNWFTSTFPDLIAFFKDLNPLVIISWVYLGSKLLPVFKTLGGWLTKLRPAMGWMLKGFSWIARAATFVAGGITAVTLAIGAAVAAVAYLGYVIYKHWSAMPEIIDEAWVRIKAALGVAAEWWGNLFGAVFDGIKTGISAVGDAIMWLPTQLWDALKTMGTYVVDFFTSLPSQIGNAISTLATWLTGQIAAAIPEWVFTALNYAGVISDDELSGIKSSRATPVVPAAPALPPAPTIGASNAAASNAEVVAALMETNKHLADINDNTAEGTQVVVQHQQPRSSNAFAGQLAAGGI